MTADPTWLPPEYVNVPTGTAYASDVDDAVVITMVRILGLCWRYNHDRTPALTPDQMAELMGRSRSALYRHLRLLREMGWIRVEQSRRRIVIRPTLAGQRPSSPGAGPEAGQPDQALWQALADIHLWARHPHRRSLTNPVGNVILKLENGERPPDEFLREASLQLSIKHQIQEPSIAQENPEEEAPEESGLREAQRLWQRALGDLQLQMTRATFDAWLRGSRVVGSGEGRMTIRVRHAYAVDWLEHRLKAVVERAVRQRAGHEVAIVFTAEQDPDLLDEEEERPERAQDEPGN